MNIPAIAQKTFDESRNNPELLTIVIDVLEALKNIPDADGRTSYIHQKINEFNEEAFSHPLVKQFSPCKMGCSACCHTQVSVTSEEAKLLAEKVHGGVSIDEERLKKQALTQNNSEAFFRLSYGERECVFLDDQGACKVYESRPSVCRTNAVLGSAKQCDTSTKQGPIRLVRTSKSDMVIYAFYVFTKSSGSLHHMLASELLVNS
jgi:Fe-S-cluster containining protein